MHGTARAVGTVWANRIMMSSVPQPGSAPVGSSCGVNMPYTFVAATSVSSARPSVSRTRRGPQRCNEIGRRAGASARNWATRSRPSRFIATRSCVGLAMPRAAANASAISSGEKWTRACWYTRGASVRTARTSIMLARSTASRHGDGRTWAKATSIITR